MLADICLFTVAWVRFGHNTSPVMQEFIAWRLARSHLPLSEKMRRLDPSHMQDLARFLRTVPTGG